MLANIMRIPSVRIALGQANMLKNEALRLGKWAVPGAVFGGWMLYPALTDSFKRTIGLLPAIPEA